MFLQLAQGSAASSQEHGRGRRNLNVGSSVGRARSGELGAVGFGAFHMCPYRSYVQYHSTRLFWDGLADWAL